jgi:hypothetical protein
MTTLQSNLPFVHDGVVFECFKPGLKETTPDFLDQISYVQEKHQAYNNSRLLKTVIAHGILYNIEHQIKHGEKKEMVFHKMEALDILSKSIHLPDRQCQIITRQRKIRAMVQPNTTVEIVN